MKICNKCHRTYEDSAFFCPECGGALVDKTVEVHTNVASDSAPGRNNMSGKGSLKEGARKRTEEWDNSDNQLMRWLPSIISILGFIIGWYLSALFGAACGICGIAYGLYSKNKVNKIISLTVGIITTIVCLIALFS